MSTGRYHDASLNLYLKEGAMMFLDELTYGLTEKEQEDISDDLYKNGNCFNKYDVMAMVEEHEQAYKDNDIKQCGIIQYMLNHCNFHVLDKILDSNDYEKAKDWIENAFKDRNRICRATVS